MQNTVFGYFWNVKLRQAMELDTEDLMRRVSRLEQSNTRLRVLWIITMLSLFVLVTGAWTFREEFISVDRIETESLVIRDSLGRDRIRFGVDNRNGVAFARFLGADTTFAPISIVAGPRGTPASVSLANNQYSKRIYIGAENDSIALINMYARGTKVVNSIASRGGQNVMYSSAYVNIDTSGTTRSIIGSLTTVPYEPGAYFYHSDGQLRMVLTLKNIPPYGLALYNQSGKNVLGLGVQGQGAGFGQAMDSNGRVVWSMP